MIHPSILSEVGFNLGLILSNMNDSVYPETLMQIAFANWIFTDQSGSGLGSSSQKKVSSPETNSATSQDKTVPPF